MDDNKKYIIYEDSNGNIVKCHRAIHPGEDLPSKYSYTEYTKQLEDYTETNNNNNLFKKNNIENKSLKDFINNSSYVKKKYTLNDINTDPYEVPPEEQKQNNAIVNNNKKSIIEEDITLKVTRPPKVEQKVEQKVERTSKDYNGKGAVDFFENLNNKNSNKKVIPKEPNNTDENTLKATRKSKEQSKKPTDLQYQAECLPSYAGKCSIF